MPQDVVTAVKEFIENLLTDEEFATQYATDPTGKAAVEGLTEHDLSGVDVQQLVGQVCGELNLPPDVRGVLQSYASGHPAPAGGLTLPPPSHAVAQQSVEQVVQHMNYVTYVSHENNPVITTNIIDNSIDNSTHVNVDGEVHGDITVDPTNVNATGDGAVANAGDGPVTAATGDGSQAVGGANNGNMSTGDGSVTGNNIDGPINTGTITGGVQADGPVTDTVVGNNNQTANVDGSLDHSQIPFGDGATQTNVHDNAGGPTTVVGRDGDATNISGNHLGDGAGISGHGNVSTHVEDNDTYEPPKLEEEVPPKMLGEEQPAENPADDPAEMPAAM